MTDDNDFTPPEPPAGVLRGVLLVLLATVLIASFTVFTLETTFVTPVLPIASALIVVTYVVIAFRTGIRWRRAQAAWAAKVSTWMTRQGARMATTQDMLDAEPLTTNLLPEFQKADYVARIERPLGDFYFAVFEGRPALFEVVGSTVTQLPDRTDPNFQMELSEAEMQRRAGAPFGLNDRGDK